MNEALQQAIYTTLTASAPLVAAVQGIYDHVPQVSDSGAGSAFPYVTLGENTVSAWATDDWSGGDAVVRVHVWSRYRGRKEALEILDLIRAALDRATFAITGYTNVTCDFLQSFVEVDPDGLTRHGVIEFRILISS